MIDDDGKHKASPESPAIPPHILEDLTPAQKKAFGLTGKHAVEKAAELSTPTKPSKK